MYIDFIKRIKSYLSQSSTFLSLLWLYRIFVKKNNTRLINTISKIKINNKLLVKYISNDSLILDIGSHGGSWAFFLSKLVNKGQVICFEALPVYANALKKAVFFSNSNNIIVENFAVNDTVSEVFLTWLDKDKNRLTGMTRLSSNKDDDFQKLKVSGITLDKYFLDNPIDDKKISFIKIDIEGAELLALKGARKTLIKHKPIIIIEVCSKHLKNFGYSVKDIYKFFNDINYIAITTVQNLEKFEEKSLNDPNFNDDIIFVHKSILGQRDA